MRTYKGRIVYIFYTKPSEIDDSIFSGFTLRIQDSGKQLKCFGNLSTCVTKGSYIEIEGEQNVTAKRFEVSDWRFVDDDEVGAYAMLQFLFGKKTAEKITQYFNLETMYKSAKDVYDLFVEDFECFRNLVSTHVKGIGAKKIDKAKDKYDDNIGVNNIYFELKNYGISFNMSLKIYDAYGKLAKKNIEENPYCLCEDFDCSFALADDIAVDKFDYSLTDPRRIQAGIWYAIHQQENSGHCFMNLDNCLDDACKCLRLEKSMVFQEFNTLIQRRIFVVEDYEGEKIVYWYKTYQNENYVAEKIVEYSRYVNQVKFDTSSVQSFIKQYQEDKNIKLANKQKDAVVMALSNNLSIISGPPGSGKTTIMKIICDAYEKKSKHFNIALCTPTGKASQQLSKSTGREATTIHQLLEVDFENEGKFKRNETNPLDLDLIIVDEVSMMDLHLCADLFRALPKKTRVVLVGDKEQLASVGVGKILDDFMNCKRIKHTILDEIFRQSADSSILQLGLDISNNNEVNLANSSDFNFIEMNGTLPIRDRVVNEYCESVANYGIDNTVLLVPQNKDLLGVDALNKVIQEQINHSKEILSFGKTTFKVGDRVIQTKNIHKDELYNGMVGTVAYVQQDEEQTCLEVQFDNGLYYMYHKKDMQNLKLAYAISVHRSQGSEYNKVIFLATEEHQYMLRKKLVYTAITRAKDSLSVIGQKEVFINAIHEESEIVRKSRLIDRIEALI